LKKKQTEIPEATPRKKLSVFTQDGFDNFLSRIGLNNENALSDSTYTFNLVTRNRILLEASYRGSWIVGAMVDLVAEDMTRAGVDITASSDEDTKVFEKAQVRLQIWSSIATLIKWGRLYGGAIGVMQIEGQDLSTPLDIETVGEGQFKGIVVYDRWMLNPILSPVIMSGPDMGLPLIYQIVSSALQNLGNPGPDNLKEGEKWEIAGIINVHHSRCIRYTGIDLPFFQAITEMMWGESVLERLWDRLVAFDNATMSSAQLIDRANLRTIGIEGLREIIAAGGQAQKGLTQMFEMMRLMQVNEGITLIDKNDEFASTAYSFAGLSDMLLQFGQQLSGASGVPMVRLFGQSPAGLNSTGESDIRMYYDTIKAQQEAKLRNPMSDLLQVLWRSTFGKPTPDDFDFEFTPLWQMDATDRAQNAKTNTETIIGAHEAGLLPLDSAMRDLRSISGETGLFSNLSEEDITDAESEEPPMPDVAPQEPGKIKKPVPSLDRIRNPWMRKLFSRDAGGFKESDHPRNDNGEFESGGSGGKGGGEGSSGKKERRPGKLDPVEGITLHSVNHVRELSAHGEDNPETCAHCGKGIKNVATINHPDEGLVKVGLDCAEALVSGEALSAVKKEIDKSKKDAARATTFGQKEAVRVASEHLLPNWKKADPVVVKMRQERLDVATKKSAELGIDPDELIGLAGRIAYHVDGGGRTWYEHLDTAVKELSGQAKKITKEKS
jgi:uncharacterized protein